MNPQADIARLVRDLRGRKDRTQEKVAAKLGVTFPTINRWENGRARPNVLKTVPRGLPKTMVERGLKLQTDAANIAGVLSALPDGRKTEVEATLTDYLRKLPERDIGRVWSELVGKFKTDAMLYCEEAWTTNEEQTIVDLRGMSDGTLRFLAIIAALRTLEEGSLLVVEHQPGFAQPQRTCTDFG